MATRLIQLLVPRDAVDAACGALGDIDAANWWVTPLAADAGGDGDNGDDDGDGDDFPHRRQIFVLLKPGQAQQVMDALQDALDDREDWRLLLLPVEAMAPEILTEEEQEEMQQSDQLQVREEMVSEVQGNATLNRNFLLMCALSTLVAAIGLTLDNIAAVIGAMVIAPLLGPLLAFSLGSALGAHRMMGRALMATAAGLGTCIAASATLALLLPFNEEARMLDYSQPIQLRTLILPLGAGAAAALLTSANQSSVFVGVAVAAALLPPIAAAGLLMGAGNWHAGARAAFLVVTNVVGITVAAQIVFMASGVRPRRWSELKAAETSRWIHLGAMAALVLAMMALVFFSNWV